MPSSLELVEAARSYIGVKWRHQGRNRQGIDCAGLLVVSIADLGIPVADKLGYRRLPDPDEFLGHIRAQTEAIGQPEFGAIGIFRGGLQPCHVGIFGELHGELSLIHAYAQVGKVIEELFLHNLPRDLIEVRRVIGIEY